MSENKVFYIKKQTASATNPLLRIYLLIYIW